MFPFGTFLPGIDVSHFNGTIDWQISSGSIAFAFAKATQGTGYVDSRFHDNWQGMQSNGIARGAYHFFDPSRDGAGQADHFLNTVRPASNDLPPVLDVETLNGANPAAVASGVDAWLTAVSYATGRAPLIYSTASFWQRLGNPQNTNNCPLWVAHYDTESPEIPNGWSSWTFWQFSHSGKCPGVSGYVDLDRFNGSADELKLLCQTASSEPEPKS